MSVLPCVELLELLFRTQTVPPYSERVVSFACLRVLFWFILFLYWGVGFSTPVKADSTVRGVMRTSM